MLQPHYDVELLGLSENSLLLKHHDGQGLELITFEPTGDYLRALVGQVGVAEYVQEGACWRFTPYFDQSLRRVAALDTAERLGWRNNGNPECWTAPRNIVPGKELPTYPYFDKWGPAKSVAIKLAAAAAESSGKVI